MKPRSVPKIIRDRISEIVAALAKTIECAYSWLPPKQQLMLRLMRMMPLYRDSNALPAWESADAEITDGLEDGSEVGELIDEVFEFGRCNFYTQFNKSRAHDAFTRVAQIFKNRGLPVPEVRKLAKY